MKPDFTGISYAATTIAEGDARWCELADQADAGLLLSDNRGQIIFANARYCALVGLPCEALVGCQVHDSLDSVEVDGSEIALVHDRLLSHGVPYTLERHLRRPDGSIARVCATVSSRRDAQGRIVGGMEFVVGLPDAPTGAELRQIYGVLEGIAEGSDDAIAALDRTFSFLYINDAYRREFRRLWGRGIRVGDSMLDAMADWPVEQRKARELWTRGLAGERFIVTAEFGPSAEAMQVYDLRFNPILDDTGQQIGAAHIIRNVTDHAQLHRARHDSELLLRRVLDSLFAFVGVLTPDGTLIEVNRGPLEVGGISAAEVLGLRFWDCYWWSYDPKIQRRVRDAVERANRGEVVRFDVPVRVAGDGRMWIDFQLAPLRDDEGRVTHLIPSAIDLTERRLAEEALKSSETHFRELAEAMPQIVYVTGGDGRTEFVNRQWDEYTGGAAADAEDLPAVVHPDDLPGLFEAWADAVQARTVMACQFRLRGIVDGKYRWFLTRAVPVLDAEGRVLRWYGTSTDIDEQRRHAEELQRAHDALQQADERKDRFVATLAHELRNPLAPVITSLTLLARESMSDRGRQAVAIGQRQVKHLTHLVDDLLDVNRITRGKIALKREPIDVASSIEYVIESFRPAAEAKGQRLVAHQPLTPIAIDADRVRFAQIVENLLSNAVKFTPDDGFIGVEAVAHGEIVEIRVADTGVGLAADQLATVFEPFTQVEQSMHRPDGGLGIGLAVVSELVELHGGTVHAESDGLSRGTTFVVRLPRTAPTAPH